MDLPWLRPGLSFASAIPDRSECRSIAARMPAKALGRPLVRFWGDPWLVTPICYPCPAGLAAISCKCFPPNQLAPGSLRQAAPWSKAGATQQRPTNADIFPARNLRRS